MSRSSISIHPSTTRRIRRSKGGSNTRRKVFMLAPRYRFENASDFGLHLCGGGARRHRHSGVCLAMVRLLLLGASGVVGRAVLQLALEHQEVAAVIAPTRNALPSHGKLTNPVTAELESLLPQAIEGWSIDAVICALGTTMKKAGSRKSFFGGDLYL